MIDRTAAAADIDAILASFELQKIRRFYWQLHWTNESSTAQSADRLEPGLKLENVAAHSWHVADACVLVAPRFPELDVGRTAMLAVVHDKLEMITGDYDPVGRDGRGTGSHAFDQAARAAKDNAEQDAMRAYMQRLTGESAKMQSDLLLETMSGKTSEARFVKAMDKIQALAFVYAKKGGDLTTEHLAFSIRYSRKSLDYFSALRTHYEVLLGKMLKQVSEFRGERPEVLEAELYRDYWSYLTDRERRA